MTGKQVFFILNFFWNATVTVGTLPFYACSNGRESPKTAFKVPTREVRRAMPNWIPEVDIGHVIKWTITIPVA